MENSILVYKPGKSKQELWECLEKFKLEYSQQMSEYNVKISKLEDGYAIKAEKKILFMNFWINAKILIREHEFDIIWETNAPENKVNEAIEKVKIALEKC